MSETRVKWWNLPQYRHMVNGFIGFVMVRLLTLFYDLAGFAPEYRNYFLWAAAILVGMAVLFRKFPFKQMQRKSS